MQWLRERPGVWSRGVALFLAGLNLGCLVATWRAWPVPARETPYLEQSAEWSGYVQFMDDGGLVAIDYGGKAGPPPGASSRMLRFGPFYGILLCYPIILSMIVSAVVLALAVRRRPLRFFLYGGIIGASVECVAIGFANLLGLVEVTSLSGSLPGSFPLGPLGWYPLSLPVDGLLHQYLFPLGTLADATVWASAILFLGMTLSSGLGGTLALVVERCTRRRVPNDRGKDEPHCATPAPLPRGPRFRVLTLMALVALVAVSIGAARAVVKLTPTVRHCRAMARSHGFEAEYWRGCTHAAAMGWIVIDERTQPMILDYNVADIARHEGPQTEKSAVEDARRRAAAAKVCHTLASFHEAMRQKWLRGARRPWGDVPPDPPPPLRVQRSVSMGQSL